jgi:hypothetical protein
MTGATQNDSGLSQGRRGHLWNNSGLPKDLPFAEW